MKGDLILEEMERIRTILIEELKEKGYVLVLGGYEREEHVIIKVDLYEGSDLVLRSLFTIKKEKEFKEFKAWSFGFAFWAKEKTLREKVKEFFAEIPKAIREKPEIITQSSCYSVLISRLLGVPATPS